MSLKQKMEEDLKQALRDRASLKVSCLRMVKAAVKNKEIDLRAELNDTQVIGILTTLAKQRRESIEMFKKGNRPDLVQKEEEELAFIETYLPKQMDEAELTKIIEAAIAEVGAKAPIDVGKVMKAVMPKVAGRADGKAINAIVLKKLS
ncbi:MAG: glutamyl-tRNA amidotransferase [Deltaproteobacteria bacterium RIFCSPLOWO2_02_FULL_46_8]|nr:MAG: glutamyl-tRNA amidotransferase [Deltaproteobacteria bacterium RIFCSPLOWO2_02_FULL_46_8]